MNTLKALITARTLIENESHWCQHEARDGNRRCALAALADASGQLNDTRPALAVLCEALPKAFRRNAEYSIESIAVFNDMHAHSKVLALFDRAIGRQRQIEAIHNSLCTMDDPNRLIDGAMLRPTPSFAFLHDRFGAP
jgi:hypothetical protein